MIVKRKRNTVVSKFFAMILLLLPLLVVTNIQVSASSGFSFQDLLSLAEGVVSVEPVEGNISEWMPEKYILTFLQQLDWNNPDAGVFLQRVEVGLHPGAAATVMETTGYSLSERQMTMDDQSEVCSILGANYVKVEHRFSGASCPEGMTNDGTFGWEYATAENEAGDYHRIFSSLSEVMGGNWFCCGTSRGGRACLDYARLYPEDNIKAYISFAGVNCNSDRDPRMVHFLASEVGNSAFGEEAGAEIRKTILQFQVELMRNKEVLSRWLWGSMNEAGLQFTEGMTESRIFDISVYEFPIGFWINQGAASELKWVLSLPEETEHDIQIKLGSEYSLLTQYGSPTTFAFNSFAWPFYASCLKWEGMYDYDYEQLRTALQQAGLQDCLAVTPEEQPNYLRNMILTAGQQEIFQFTPGHYEALDSWAKQTTQHVLFIGGDLDPWSAVYINGGTNPNFQTYICQGQSHYVQIADLDPETQAEIILALYSWSK